MTETPKHCTYCATGSCLYHDESARRHDTDGQPFLAYYRRDLTMSFVWDGCIEHSVQVGREFGERIEREFLLDLPDGLNPAQLLLRFQNACDAFARIPEE